MLAMGWKMKGENKELFITISRVVGRKTYKGKIYENEKLIITTTESNNQKEAYDNAFRLAQEYLDKN